MSNVGFLGFNILRFFLIFTLFIILQLNAVFTNDCLGPIGVGDGRISDDRISASSSYDDFSRGFRGRLNIPYQPPLKSGWCARDNDQGQFLEIDLGRKSDLRAMATQGRGREAFNHWVKEYYVSYREGESGLWIPFIKSGETQALMFTGNSDPFTVVYHAFNRSIQARYFRFHPVEWNVQICMRVELYGCLVLTGEEDIVIDDDDLLIIFIVLLVISAIFTILVLVLLLTMRKLLKRMERKLIESRTGLSLRDSVDGKKSSYEKPVYTTIIKSKQKSSERKSTNTNDSNSPRMKEQGTQRNKIETLDL